MLYRLCLAIALIISVPLAAQTSYRSADIPAALKSRANAVIRDMETVIDMRAPDNVSVKVRQVITVMNKNGDANAGLILYYNKNNIIKSIKGLVYNDAGLQVSKFNQSNFTDESAINDFSLFEDERVKYFKPSLPNYPYTIVYEYELRSRQNLIIPDWYATPSPDVSVEQNSYRFICQPGDKLHIKTYNYPGTAIEKLEDKSQIYSWKVQNIPAFQTEPWSPSPNEYLTRVKIAPEKFSYYTASSSYTNWKELGKWIYTDLLSKRQNLSPETIQMVKSLVKDLTDPKEKAKKIYEYMQQKTRYVSVQIGIGGFQPIPASEVDRMGYGDCKGLVNYTQSLLNAVDIPSLYCVVYAGQQKRSLDPTFASMDQANHIILCLPFQRDTTWLECTSQTLPFGFLGDFTDDRMVLACGAEGGKLLHTPVLTTQDNRTIRTAVLNIDVEGNVKGTMNTRFEGAAYDNCEALISDSPEERIKSLKAKYDIDNIEFQQMKFSQVKTAVPFTTENIELSIRNYVSKTQSRAYLLLNAFNKAESIPEVTNRTRPVMINRGFTELDTIQYHLPDGFKIESEMENIQIKNDFGTYTVKTSLNGNCLTYSRSFVLKEGSYAPERYRELVEFISRVKQSDHSKTLFKLN